jgi:glyoxylase-like metal-dependent hydrolase (beta-lactamase superfamily II)
MRSFLPGHTRVVVRDWLNSNHIILLGRHTVLIDTGYGRDAKQTLERLQAPDAIGNARPDLIANTHCHSDHMGGNALLAMHYASPVAVPRGELEAIDQWNEETLWLDYADQRCARFRPQQAIDPEARLTWGDGQWRALPAPGHDMHALMYWSEEDRLLITGDALWENGFGVLLPGTDAATRLRATRETLNAIGALQPRAILPGHGPPFFEVDAALERAHGRLDALAADEMRMVRSVLKTMFVFSLLDRRRLPVAQLADYLARVPLYREYNVRYLGWDNATLARWLCDELIRSAAVVIRDGFLEAAI